MATPLRLSKSGSMRVAGDDSAIKRWIQPDTGVSVTVVSLQMPDGQFIASIAEDQTLRATGPTRQAAEEAALQQVAAFQSRPNAAELTLEEWLLTPGFWPEEDAEDLASFERAATRSGIPYSEIRAKYGR